MTQYKPSFAQKCTPNNFGGNYNKELKSLIKCLNFATEAHKNQKRKDVEKTPYINHPIGVAYIISEEADMPNLDLLRGCLLHDTVEDTPVVIEDIRKEFGDYIGNLIEEVTDDKALNKQKRKDLQIIHARTSSPQAKIVKLADKLYNLRDLEKGLPEGWTEERRREYFEWAFQVCKGLRGISSKLEAKLGALFTKKGLMAHWEPSVNIPSWTKHEELKYLIAAANFAAKKHSCHIAFNAKNGVPYINHIVSVANIVSEEADIQDITVLCAALLCDVVGKAGVPKEEIVDTFGKDVGNLVAELTYDHSQTLEDQFKNQMSRIATMSFAAKVITLAAVIDNCRRLKSDNLELGFQHQYLQWAKHLTTLLVGTHVFLERQMDLILINLDN